MKQLHFILLLLGGIALFSCSSITNCPAYSYEHTVDKTPEYKAFDFIAEGNMLSLVKQKENDTSYSVFYAHDMSAELDVVYDAVSVCYINFYDGMQFIVSGEGYFYNNKDMIEGFNAYFLSNQQVFSGSFFRSVVIEDAYSNRYKEWFVPPDLATHMYTVANRKFR